MTRRKLATIGEVGVDTGRLVIVDPAYLEDDGELQALLQQAEDFGPTNAPAAQLYYMRGHAGLGVVLTTGWGDGRYEVQADVFTDELGNTRIREVRIRFVE